VYDYRTGKQDWMGAGLPTEGTNTEHPRLIDVVRRDVPTCSLGERLGEVRSRVIAAGWDACVVVSQERVVLGLLRTKELQADPDLLVDRVMRPGPSTYRPYVSVADMRRIMIDRNLPNSPVTTSDGKLVGLVRQQDLGPPGTPADPAVS
jgi:CBS domain-containing protein